MAAPDQVSINDLADEKLSATTRVFINDLADEKLSATTIGSMLDTMLEETDLGLYVSIKQDRLVIQGNIHLPIKKTVIFVGLLLLLWQYAPSLATFIPLLLASLAKSY